jgi:hypothetical protein
MPLAVRGTGKRVSFAMYKALKSILSLRSVGAALFLCALPLQADDTNLEREVRELREQNAALQRQLQKQDDRLDTLTKKVGELEAAGSEHENAAAEDATPTKNGFNFGKVNVSGEGGAGFFNSGSEGFAPHSEFRVDEARLFVEAPVWNEVYFYGEADGATRENTDLNFKLGELYLDFQDASQLWGKDNQFNIRAGRMNIPFGEEYLTRYAIDNPLISHSLSDFWGVDPGIEFYGTLGKFCYAVAVQNGGGANGVQDFDGDKSVAGRIGYDPVNWLHLSVSGMRTGDLSAQNDMVSALWFGNGFFRSLGSPETTTFHANMVEGDVTARWSSGHVSAFGGYARYGDNDPAADNARGAYYYSVEGVQQLPHKFYTAARFSEIITDQGFPIVGNGNFGDYFFDRLSTELWRLSLGLGYRFNDRLIVKAEYSLERGKEVGGDSRDEEDFFGTEAAFRF